MSLRLKLNNVFVEVDAEGIEIPLTLSVADMKQPDKRKTSSSKTITIQGTQNNLNILRGVYSLPISDLDNPLGLTFDPRTRIEAIYEVNGITIFEGLFQVLKAIRTGETYQFECVLFSNIANVVESLGELKISDLNFSEYNHTLDKDIIRASWDDSVIVNGSPISNFTGVVPDGFGYIYGWFDLGLSYPYNSPLDQKTNQLILGVYFKEVLSKMMAAINQPYELSFDDAAFWKRLTLFNEGNPVTTIDATSKAQRSAELENNIPNITSFPNAIYNIPVQSNGNINLVSEASFPLSSIVSDWSDQVQPNGSIVIGQTGTYKVSITGDVDVTLTGLSSLIGVSGQFQVQLKRNGNVLAIATTGVFPTALSTPQNYTWNVEGEYAFTQGDSIELVMSLGVNGFTTAGQTLTVTITQNTATGFELESLDGEISDGDNIDITRYLPTMKCADFYRSIMRMFNLYQEDGLDGITITPATDYYGGTGSTSTDDWSDILDYSQTIEIEPPNRIEGKNYIFKYTTETDFMHELYRQEFAESYGDNTFTVPNTWQVGKNVLEVGFSIGIPRQQSKEDLLTEVVMPSIYKLNNGVKQTYKGKSPRVYIYNGIINVPSSDACALYDSDLGAADPDPLFITNSGDWGYPAFHHLLNPTAPTFDILFAPPQRLYYPDGVITNNTLFVAYWEKFIKELTSADSKILTAYFKLSNLDIHNLDFKRLKNIDGVVYRLNVVFDFMGQNKTTKCELIKVIEGDQRQIRSNLPIGIPNGEVPALNPNPIIDVDGDSGAAALRAGQMGYDRLANNIYINTGTTLVKFAVTTVI